MAPRERPGTFWEFSPPDLTFIILALPLADVYAVQVRPSQVASTRSCALEHREPAAEQYRPDSFLASESGFRPAPSYKRSVTFVQSTHSILIL